jgi:hypothetical protein
LNGLANVRLKYSMNRRILSLRSATDRKLPRSSSGRSTPLGCCAAAGFVVPSRGRGSRPMSPSRAFRLTDSVVGSLRCMFIALSEVGQVGLLDLVPVDAEPVERRRHVDRIPRDHAVGQQVQAHGLVRLLLLLLPTDLAPVGVTPRNGQNRTLRTRERLFMKGSADGSSADAEGRRGRPFRLRSLSRMEESRTQRTIFKFGRAS